MTLAIGIDLGATNMRIGLVDSHGNLLHFKKEPISWQQPIDQLTRQLVQNIQALPHFPEIMGVGLAIAATVTPQGQIQTEDANISLPPEFSLAQHISQKINRPVIVDNDANLALWGEVCFGAARGADDVLLLTLGTGIGGGLLLDGRLRRGKHGIAGEVGLVHFMHPNGSGYAAVESFASPGALANRLGSPGIKLRELESLLNGKLQHLLDEMAEHIALLIINAHLLLDLEIILLGGGFAENGEWVRKKIEKAVKKIAPAGMVSNLRIELGRLTPDTAGVIGAAAFLQVQQSRSMAELSD